jgi:23S rRNA pseudouridine1911/1915/1917 synthase
MEPTLLYEDEDMLAIHKPAGLVVHGDGKTNEPSVADWMLQKYPQAKEVGEPSRAANGEIIYRPGIVHRLDRETSGVMLVAKTQKGFENLKTQFQNHEIKKIYYAFVYGEMKQDTGTIDRPIGRSNKDFRMWSAQRGARGELREAVTDYEVALRSKGYSFVRVMPKTGRTHQIRVHFKAISYPLVGDSLYAPTRDNTLGFSRLALHSYETTFLDVTGNSHTVNAPYPEDFTSALTVLQSS